MLRVPKITGSCGRPGLKEIAARLNLSPKTVEFHKHQIVTEFDVKSNAGLVLFAIKKGLISIDPDIVYAERRVS